VVDLSAARPVVCAEAAGSVEPILAMLGTPPAARQIHLPNDRRELPKGAIPSGCAVYRLIPLPGLVGLLELGWREPPTDSDLRALAALLPLATLLAEDRLVRDRANELQGRLERSCHICAAS